MFDLMIDLETMGTGPTAAIVSIGARFFSIENEALGPKFEATIHLGSAMAHGGTIEAGTVIWWLQQNDQARKNICFGGRDIKVVLQEFSDWIAETCRHEDVRPWGNSASFDCMKIQTACERVGIKTPWYWTNERCFRSVRHMFPRIEYDPSQKGDAAHTALADADFQIEHLFRIKRERKTV
jgi:hypothetical protein